MRPLSLASPNQLQSTLGRIPRLSLAAALREAAPGQLAEARGFEQEQARLDQERQALALQGQALTLAEDQQAAQQRQGTIGTVISGLGTLGSGAVAAKQLGLFGGGTAATSAGTLQGPTLAGATLDTASGSAAAGAGTAGTAAGATPAALEAGGVAVDTGGAATATGAAGTAAASGATTTGFPALATVGGAAAGAGIAGAGAIGGTLTGKAVEQKVGGTGGKVAGHATGAATGAAIGAGLGTVVFPGIGTAAGAVIGAAAGGLGASFCPIHTCSYGNGSLEVDIARAYRSLHLDAQTLRGYYMWGEPTAAAMRKNPVFREQIRTQIVDPLVRYGARSMHMPYHASSARDERIARHWLAYWAKLGGSVPVFRRVNGESV